MASSQTSTRTLPTLHEFFSPGGILSKSPLPYEYRPGQLEMAKAVERALTERRHLIVEAGTGTGKTLAYLLPALRTGQRIIVSTGTKALQDQLFFRDVPFLESLLGNLQVCYMKGRANYLCRHKLVALRDQPILSGLEEIDQYRQIAEWEKTTETGDRSELSELPESSALWHKLDARSDACLGSTCPDYRRCFITEMRRRALESDIIIVNHHLFFADLAVKQQASGAPDAGILPEAAAVIFDEAHELEDVASSYFGLPSATSVLKSWPATPTFCSAPSPAPKRMPAATQQLRDRARMFFSSLPSNGDGRQPFDNREEFLETSGDLYLSLRTTLRLLESEMELLTDIDEAPGLRKRVARLRDRARIPARIELQQHGLLARTPRSGGAKHRRTPSPGRGGFIAVAPHLSAGHAHRCLGTAPRDGLRNHSHRVLTSATLTVQGGFEHIRKRLGMTDARELVVPSHFRYGEQALLYLPPNMPDPRDPDFPKPPPTPSAAS